MTKSEEAQKEARPWDFFKKSIGRTPIEIAKERYSICKNCPQFIPITTQCKECGCIMKAKVKLPHASCPLEKWDAIVLDSFDDEKVEEVIDK